MVPVTVWLGGPSLIKILYVFTLNLNSAPLILCGSNKQGTTVCSLENGRFWGKCSEKCGRNL